jgi:hypothetical protein
LQRVWFRGRHPRQQFAVHEQPPDLLKRHIPDQVLDVHASVAERSTGSVRLGDLGGEGDYALEARLNFGGCCHDAQD